MQGYKEVVGGDLNMALPSPNRRDLPTRRLQQPLPFIDPFIQPQKCLLRGSLSVSIYKTDQWAVVGITGDRLAVLPAKGTLISDCCSGLYCD